MSYCLQSKLFHLFVFITSKSRSMPRVACGACPRFHLSVGSSRLPFSTAFAFNGRRLFGDFPHLNSGRDLQIFDAHIFRCCFVLLIGAVPALWGPFSSPPVVLLVVALLLLLPLYPLFLLLLLLYLSLSLPVVDFAAAVERNAVIHWKGFRGI